MGKPMSLGISLFAQKYQYIGSGFNFSNSIQLQQSSLFGLSSIDADTLFTQKSVGGVLTLSTPLQALPMQWVNRKFRRFSGFTRLGISYSLSSTSIEDPAVNRNADPADDIPVTFRQPRIMTSRITPNLLYNSLNAYQDPTRGTSLYLGFQLSGGILGGDVNTFAPSLEYKYFLPVFKTRSEKPHVIGMRLRADHIRTFGKPFQTDSLSFVGGIPLYERFYLGGEYDIRGYNIRSISPVVATDSYLSTRNVAAKVLDPTATTPTLIDAPPGLVNSSVLRNYQFEAPEGACTQQASANCNVVKGRTFFTPIGGDTQFIYNIEYRVPIIGPLSAAAFADMGTTFNARRYSDQITKTEFINQTITPSGVTLNPAGRLATADELANAPKDVNGNPVGYRTIFLQGDSRSYDIVRNSQGNLKRFLSDIRSSYGAELRVQMPVINVPFRLIFAYNPQAKTDITDPSVLFIERRTAVRFSVGRTF
jgi:outer membrane protein insertion porin family